MRKLRRVVGLIGAAGVGIGLALGLGAGVGADPGTVMKFDTMAPVTGPYVGTANPVRGVAGGGLPWMITNGRGILQADGHIVVHVRGLVLAKTAPVPPALQGTNPIADFKAVVSCQTTSAGAAAVSNVESGQFPASADGNSNIDDQVTLPTPCIAPIVFVTSPAGAWFAATGAG
ncbi:MAG: hypothetical protein J2P45_16980 [Candidatus Dormibacteraeota bacterium]|nr:hypothetical protein [Candidatus Dormibacteraeota bacterium]